MTCAFCSLEPIKTIKTDDGHIMQMCRSCYDAFEYGTAVGEGYEDLDKADDLETEEG